ncbi:MAG: hypothetical protein NVS3B18_10930 [Candidatus Dormibacteria bacterium]
MNTTVDVGDYNRRVIGLDARSVYQNGLFLIDPNHRSVSVMQSPFDLADFCLITLAVAVEAIVRGTSGIRPYLLAGVLGVALVLSGTRADLIGAGVLTLVILMPVAGAVGRDRLRLALIVVVAVAFVLPGLGSSRISGAQGANASATEHTHEIGRGVKTLVGHPLGTGLGTAAGTGQRFGLSQQVTSDNSVLQVGDELGIVMMALFVLLVGGVVTALGRSAGRRPDDPLPRTAQAAMIGLAAAGMFHHVLVYLPVAWIVWAAAGVALGTDDQRPATSPITW